MIYLVMSRLTPEQVVDVTRQVLLQVESLWGRYELITSVGHRENAGHRFVTAEVASQMEAEWRQQIRSTPPDKLIQEKPLLKLLRRAKHDADEGEPVVKVDPTVEMTSALLRSAVVGSRSQTVGNRAVYATEQLSWQSLVEVVGGEDELRARLDPLRAMEDAELRSLVALCDRYLEGWRPD